MADKFDFIEDYFKKGELLPAIVQERSTGQVLMLAYMNRESMRKTFETGYTWFYSRSRQELWNKGATSGHLQKVIDVKGDCDKDTLLVIVDQTGPACHTGSQEGSYTCYLFEKGLDKILKKVGEECSETIIAAKNGDNKETVLEISDLIYHLFVMMAQQGITVDEVMDELAKRSQKTGNLKQFHTVDKNT